MQYFSGSTCEFQVFDQFTLLYNAYHIFAAVFINHFSIYRPHLCQTSSSKKLNIGLRGSWVGSWREKIYRNAGLLNYLQTKHPRNRQELGIEKEIRFRGKRRHVLQKFPSSKNLQTSPEFNNQPAFVENIIGFICGGKRSINN